jgi:hypothetical protein
LCVGVWAAGCKFGVKSAPPLHYTTPCFCSEFTRLTPKVKDIVFVATMKVILKPLVEKVPGFGE